MFINKLSKKILFIPFSLIALSCANTKEKSSFELSGKYQIVSYSVDETLIEDRPKRNKIDSILQKKGKFNFVDDSVHLDPEFGMAVFGDSIFEYSIDSNFIVFENSGEKIDIPYKKESINVNFLVDRKGIESFIIIPSSMMPSKKN